MSIPFKISSYLFLAIVGLALPGFVLTQMTESTKLEGVDDRTLDELVAAGRILAHLQVVDAFGHVSVRHPTKPGHFLLARSVAPALAKVEDIMEFDANGEPVDARGRKVVLERYIHAEVYRKRPDVLAVVHSHSPAIVPFSVSDVKLRPIGPPSAFLYKGVPVFDSRSVETSSSMLIANNKLGSALADKLGDASVVLLRGHGDVVVGTSIPNVVARAYYTEVNAKLQRDAIALGGSITFLSEEEGRKTAEQVEPTMVRAWELWRREIAAAD